MIARGLTGLGGAGLRLGLRLILQLWPLWLFWLALRLSLWLWRVGVLTGTNVDRSAAEYAFAHAAWPSAGLIGPILLMLGVIALYRAGTATRVTAIAGIGGVGLALALTLKPAWDNLAARAGQEPALDLLGSIPLPYGAAFAVGLLGLGLGIRLFTEDGVAGAGRSGGHADLKRALRQSRARRLALDEGRPPPLPRARSRIRRHRRRRGLPWAPAPQ